MRRRAPGKTKARKRIIGRVVLIRDGELVRPGERDGVSAPREQHSQHSRP